MSLKKLPTFRGYTVDNKLGQFRKAEAGKLPEFIEFKSERGQEVMKQLRQEGYTTLPMVLNDHGEWTPDFEEM